MGIQAVGSCGVCGRNSAVEVSIMCKEGAFVKKLCLSHLREAISGARLIGIAMTRRGRERGRASAHAQG